jgi:hypothetical protein
MRAMVSMDPATWSYETKASIYCAAILAERGELLRPALLRSAFLTTPRMLTAGAGTVTKFAPGFPQPHALPKTHRFSTRGPSSTAGFRSGKAATCWTARASPAAGTTPRGPDGRSLPRPPSRSAQLPLCVMWSPPGSLTGTRPGQRDGHAPLLVCSG